MSSEEVAPKSRPSLLELIARGAGFLIMLGACPLILLAMGTRMDDADDLPRLRIIDAVLGLALAIGYVLRGIPWRSKAGNVRSAALSLAIKAMVLWALVSGGLMSCHQHQIWVRDRASDSVTIYHLERTLEEYRRDTDGTLARIGTR